MSDTHHHLTSALADRYRIERELGHGGMATVYLAEDLKHHRKVALKVLRPELAAVIGAERFLQEITTTANLQHPHILTLHDSGTVDGTAFYVMPYVEGESLRDRLNRETQLPIAVAVRIAQEVAGALDYAHRHGVIHRDIKPENILLHDGRALVADFGIALAASSAGSTRMTETGMSLGTPTYMSPEQAMGERTLDARSDVYALGCVLYEMLTGEAPFTGPTAQAIVAKVMTAAPVPPAELRSTVPEHVNAAVLSAIEKLPADRFAGAADLARALDDPTFRSTARTRAIPSVARPRRPAALPAILGATTILALAWGTWQATRRNPVPPAPVVRFTVPNALGRAFGGNTIAISPDGTRLVFVQETPDLSDARLVLRRLDGFEAVPIAGTEGAVAPFFSPDGNWIGFYDEGRIRKIRVDGGGLTTIVDLGTMAAMTAAAWGPGDMIVFTTRTDRLRRVSAAGGQVERIVLEDTMRYRQPSWLPDGKHLAVARQGAGPADFEIVVLRVEDGKTVATVGAGLSPQYVEPGFLSYLSPDGALMAAPFDVAGLRVVAPALTIVEGLSYLARALPLAVSQSGAVAYSTTGWSDKELVVVTEGREPRALPVGTRAFRGPRFSPDGRRIVVDVEPGGDLNGDIWIFDIGPETFTRLTFEGSSVFPEWTPDGQAVLYSAIIPDGRRGILRVPADRSAPPTVIVSGQAPAFEAVLTPDGKNLLYRVNADSTGRDILLLPSGGEPVRWAAGRFMERSPALTRDGQLVAYVSDEAGREEVYLKPLAGGGATQVSSFGGVEPRWGPGDREVYYRRQDTLFAVPVTRGPSLRIGARRAAVVGAFVSEPYHANYDIAPDGRSFVFVRQSRGSALTDVAVVLNWFQSAALSITAAPARP